MKETIRATLYLDSVKKIKAAEGNKELQMALVDDHIENGESATKIIQALLDRNKVIVDMLPEIKMMLKKIDCDCQNDGYPENSAKKYLDKLEQWETPTVTRDRSGENK